MQDTIMLVVLLSQIETVCQILASAGIKDVSGLVDRVHVVASTHTKNKDLSKHQMTCLIIEAQAIFEEAFELSVKMADEYKNRSEKVSSKETKQIITEGPVNKKDERPVPIEIGGLDRRISEDDILNLRIYLETMDDVKELAL